MFEGILFAMFSDHLSVLSISFVRSMKHAFFQQIPVYHQLLLMDNPMVIIPSFADFTMVYETSTCQSGPM